MDYEIIVMILVLILVLGGVYIIDSIKTLKRRMLIKKIEVPENINYLINELKRNMKNNIELKNIQNKVRINQIIENILLILPLIILLISLPFFGYMIALQREKMFIIFGSYILVIVVVRILFPFLRIYPIKNYLKNKDILKEYIYNEFLKKINYDIKWYGWYDKKLLPVTSENINTWNLYVHWEDIYKKANFNKIQYDENMYQDEVSVSFLDTEKNIDFEDNISGMYKGKHIIAISDFKEYKGYYRNRRLVCKGIFCTIKMDNNILNDIRITNDKKSKFFIEKHYLVTTMPEHFYKNFIILAKNGYKISEKISEKSLEIIENFYNNSKIKFDISIKNNEIFFRFKTIDTMELNVWKNIIDDLMLKEYANIIMFVIQLYEEINNNWK